MLKAKFVMIVTVLVAGLACMSPAQEQKVENTVEALEGLNYPQVARLARLGGRVVVRVKLDDAGKVVSASAMPSGRTQGVMVPDALSNAQKWRFRPNPGKEAVIIYEFRIEEYCTDFEIEHRVPSRFNFEVPNLVTVTACPLPVGG